MTETLLPPSKEQIAIDKANFKAYHELRLRNSSKIGGGKAGFIFLGPVAWIIIIILSFVVVDSKIVRFVGFLLGLAACVCCIIYGFKFMDQVNRNDTIENDKKRTKFWEENNMDEAKSRALKYPNLYQ